MSVLFKDVEDDSTITVDTEFFNSKEDVVIQIIAIQKEKGIEDSEAIIYLDVHTAIQLRKALSLNIGIARNSKGGSNE